MRFLRRLNMFLLGIGLLLLALKVLEIGAVANWSWYVIAAPFLLTVAWWAWADSVGYTKRKEMEKMEKRKQERIDKHKEAMGIAPKKPR